MRSPPESGTTDAPYRYVSRLASKLQRRRHSPAARLLQEDAFIAAEVGVETTDRHAALVEGILHIELDRRARLQPRHARIVPGEEIEGLNRLAVKFLAKGRHAGSQIELRVVVTLI